MTLEIYQGTTPVRSDFGAYNDQGTWKGLKETYRKISGVWTRLYLTDFSELDKYGVFQRASSHTLFNTDYTPTSQVWASDGSSVILAINQATSPPLLRQLFLTTPWSPGSFQSSAQYTFGSSAGNAYLSMALGGTRLYIGDTSATDIIRQYNLSTPFNLGTAGGITSSYNPESAQAFQVVDSGTKFVGADSQRQILKVRSMGTPYLIGSVGAVIDQYNFSTALNGEQIAFFNFYDSGNKLVLTTDAGDAYFFSLNAPYSMTGTPSRISAFGLNHLSNSAFLSTWAVASVEDGGTKLMATVSQPNVDFVSVHRLDLIGGTNEVTNQRAVNYRTKFISGLNSWVSMSEDGNYIFDSGRSFSTTALARYPLTTPFQVNTAAALPDQTLSAAGGTLRTARAHCWSQGGTHLYLCGDRDSGFGTEFIQQYTCSTPYDLSTATFAGESSLLGTWEPQATGIWVDTTGRYLYIVGGANGGGFNGTRDLLQFRMSTPHSINTVSWNTSVAMPYLDGLVGVALGADNRSMVLFTDGGMAHRVTLGGANSLSGLTYGPSFNITESSSQIGLTTHFPSMDRDLHHILWVVGDDVHQLTAW